MKRVLSVLLCFVLIFCILFSNFSAFAKSANNVVTEKQRNNFYKHSAFIGSSLGQGQKYYFNRQGKGYLGSPVMLVQGSYSFYNDKKGLSKWMIHYKGKAMKAKDAVKKSGVKRVFINMGANDFYYGADKVFKDYTDYVKGIRKVNPDVVIFIESTTGVTASRQGTYLNTKNVKKLNKLMEKFCSRNKDMYFIDVGSKLLDKKGHLKRKYASDNYVHLTDSAYKIWTEEMIKYTDKLMLRERNAKKAVRNAERKKTAKSIKIAQKRLDALEDSTVKDELSERLSKIIMN